MNHRGYVLAVVLCTGGCLGTDAPGARPGGESTADHAAFECAENRNDEVRLRLARNCASCHGAGSARPMFASRAAFEELVAYNPALVVPGDPGASRLVALLDGRGTPPLSQMPPDGAPFAARAASGQTDITVAEIQAWIRTLPPRAPLAAEADPSATNVRRLTAGEVISAIEVALGQAPRGGAYPLLVLNGPSALQPLAIDAPLTPAEAYPDPAPRMQVWAMLGGEGYLRQTPPAAEWSAGSLLTLTQLAQGACASAVERNVPVLFAEVSRDARLPAAAAQVRANLAYLYRRFLHSAPEPATLEALYTDVFVPAERVSSRAAWTQVCTALIRDPLFITF